MPVCPKALSVLCCTVLAAGVALSDYRVLIDGRPVPLVEAPKPTKYWKGQMYDRYAQPYWAALVDAHGEVEVRVESTVHDLSQARIIPEVTTVGERRAEAVTFKAKVPFKVSVEPGSRYRSVAVIAREPDREVPKRDDPKVRYFAAGRHHLNEPIRLGSNETLYLEAGAIVEAGVFASGTNIAVRGHGVLSGVPWAWKKGPQTQFVHFKGAKDVRVKDVTLLGPYHWSLVLENVEGVDIDGIAILGGRVINDDGIDICRSRNVMVRNSFFHLQDDNIAVKWWAEDVTVENCVFCADVARIVHIGGECDPPPRGMRRIKVRNVDVLHQSICKPTSGEPIVHVNASNEMSVEDVRIEGVRIWSPERADMLARIETAIVHEAKGWAWYDAPGVVSGVTIKDVRYLLPVPSECGEIKVLGHDAAHPVRNVSFDGLNIAPTVDVNEHVANICVGKRQFGTLSNEVHWGNVFTEAPGWTFTDADTPTFGLTGCTQCVRWTLEDWRGKPLQTGAWPKDGRLSLAPLPPGYYRVKRTDATGRAAEPFTFCVATTNRCRSLDSMFAADAALSGCSRRGVYACPWYGGDCWHVTAELLGKCGIVHTRERLEWGIFIEPKKGSRDFSRYLSSARAMKENGVVSTGLFHDTPPWMRRPGRKLPGDLLELYRFMEDAARTFEPYYDAWEFWNEQDLGSTTEPSWEYVAALKAYALGTRAGSQTTVILPGALSAVDHFGYGQNMFDGEIAKYIQAFNIHTYENPCDYDQWHRGLRQFLAEAGIADWQVWLTESGTNLEGNGLRPCPGRKSLMAHTEVQEMILAEFYPKSCILHRQAGICRNWYFLFGCYNEQGGARDWGSMRRDGTVKPVHAAMAAASSELGDAEQLGEKRLAEGVRGFVFRKPDGSRTLAFWSVSNLERPGVPPIAAVPEYKRTFSLDARDGTYRLMDMMGTPKDVAAKDGRLVLEALRYPQYLSELKAVSADIPAIPAGRIACYVPPQDEDLTVVIRPETNPEDFSIAGRKCIAELEKSEGRLRVEVWNLSPEAKKGHLSVSAGRLAGGDGEIEIAPWGKTVVEARYAPPAKEARFNLDISGLFNGKRATRVRVPMVNVPKLLGDCETVPLPALNDPTAWRRNDSGCTYSCVYDKDEKAVRFDVEWNMSSGVWFFPVHEFSLGETFAGGRYLEFEVKCRQDKVENDMSHVEVMCLYEGKPRKSAPFAAPTFEWEKRRALLPEDADEMRGFRVGGLPRGRKLTYWVRNFRLIREHGR